MGTADLTVAVAGSPVQIGGTFSSGPVELDALPLFLQLPGPSLGYNTHGQFGESISTTFDLRITFDGLLGSQPYIDITGTVTGYLGGDWLTVNMGANLSVNPMSATAQGWSTSSGVPLTLIDEYLNLSSYHLTGDIEGGAMNYVGFGGTIDPSTPGSTVAAPEPASILLYLTTLAGLWLMPKLRTKRTGRDSGSVPPIDVRSVAGISGATP